MAGHADECPVCRQLLSRLVIECALDRRARGETISIDSDRAEFVEQGAALRAGDTVGRYRIVSLIGRGAMGTVYCAFDEELERDVALKLTTSPTDGTTHREAQALAQLEHQNVVSVYDVGLHRGQQYIAMQLIGGIDFARWLGYRKRSSAAVVDVIRFVARGLAAAHGRGIVHRDVKPENILVGADGEVAIGDFGLALPADVHQAPAAGTPVYMAPEVLAGGEATAQSDQFSLAVTLLEALTGQRPHGVERRGEAFAIRPRSDSPSRAIERKLRKPIDRALAVDPSARHDDIQAFADALAPTPRRTRLRLAALAVAALGFASAYALVARDEPARCAAAGDAVATTWNQAQALALRTRGEGGRATDSTIEYLDDYAASLRSARVAACQDDRAGRQSLELGVRRSDCLDARAASFAALVSALASGGPAALRAAPGAVRGLPQATDCADSERLAETVPLPTDGAMRQRVIALRGTLDALDAALALGDEKRAASLLDEAAPLATEIEHAPTRARHLHSRAEVLHRRGELEAAEEALREGVGFAARGKDDVIAARLWLTWAGVVGYKRRDTKRAVGMLDSVRAAVARAGDRPMLAANLANTEGLIHDFGGQYEDAAVHYRRALDIANRALGRDHPATIRSLTNLAIVLGELGETAASKETWQRVLESQRRVLGPEHPDVARTLGSIARIALRDRDFETAERLSRDVLSTFSASLGEDHPSTLLAKQRLASVYSDIGRPNEALALDRAVLATTTKLYGAEHPRTLDAKSDLVASLRRAGANEEAATVARDAIRVALKSRADDERFLGRVYNNLANALADLGKLDEAIAAVETSVAYKRKAYKPGHPALVGGAANLAELLCTASRSAEGIRATDAVLGAARELGDAALGSLRMTRASCFLSAARPDDAVREAKAGHDALYATAATELERGEIVGLLARALIAAGRPSARSQLEKALGHLRAAGESGKKLDGDLRAWARRHRLSHE